ncbi:MAG TPA: ABC transporter substrate-binding protein [Candidatus Eremiobacteraceae bacterium]|nr:ABC transporter substrate-binding protein [Candidatus Eremiobacteraceae bacterium]
MPRIVSLLASGTEIVCALGAGECLVGRSHECDRPVWVRRLPACTRPTFDVSQTSGEIDAEVRRRLRTGEPLYSIDADLIETLHADILIAQVHCDVCAVTPDDARRAGTDAGRHVVALQAGSVKGIFDDIASIGGAVGLEDAASALIADLKAQIESVRLATGGTTPRLVLVLEWTDPIFVAGNWMPELIEAANGMVALGDGSSYSSQATLQEVESADPDILIVAPCGFDLDRTLKEISYLESLPGWNRLRAVRDGNVIFADGNAYFNRSGTSIADTAEILAEIIHGIGKKHYRTAWLPYGEARIAAEINRRHSDACARGLATYADPTTGYEVMTADFLRRRGACCSSGCRHCPYKGFDAEPTLTAESAATGL